MNQSISQPINQYNQSIQSINQPINQSLYVSSHLKGSRPHLAHKADDYHMHLNIHHCVPAEHTVLSPPCIYKGLVMDHGSPVGLLPHGCYPPPPPTMADSQPLPGSHQQKGDIREQGLPVGAV